MSRLRNNNWAVLSAKRGKGGIEMKIEKRRCWCWVCDHSWWWKVEYSNTTPDLSREETIYCPKCDRRGTVTAGRVQMREEEEDVGKDKAGRKETWVTLSKKVEELLGEAVFQFLFDKVACPKGNITPYETYERVLIQEDTGEVIFKTQGELVYRWKKGEVQDA